MKVSELVPALPAENRAQFSLRQQRRIPSVPGCYALASLDGGLMYVGLSENLFRRFAEHVTNDEKLACVEGSRAYWFHWLPLAKDRVNYVERGWQNQYFVRHGRLPPLNKNASPIR